MELKLSLELVNKILAKLGEAPYASVYPLIIEINNVCLPQLPPQEAPANPATDPAVVTDVEPVAVQ